ncbi:hypothetical protein D7V97_30195 [Corallococcus sp. CA053C]|uniref:hypothetical protein n=1 Tax=Corallococcus sp. CA053C TaxID=2316732 RepID=UPI000EA1173B|nr:hypothetical protein [Corallococcus sp. CA053C]RKH00550.1 hypothetical protein D7V97_30195 [Corallococcus sp. CA053C]
MKEYVEQRLVELRGELDLGQKQLALLEARGAELKNTLLRISGAIQVLEDVVAQAQRATPSNGHAPPEPPPAR